MDRRKARTPSRESRIADNPSAKRMAEILPLVKPLKAVTGVMKRIGPSSEILDEIHRNAAAVVRESDVLELPDRFNEAFAERGWVATQSFSVDTMRNALLLHDEGRHEDAEEEILAWFDEESINLHAINRSKGFDETGQRWHQLREALRLTFEERYWAAVPLILIACDGFASEILGTSPFGKDADLTVFDSVAGHPTSLPTLIAKVTKTVRKSTSDEMTLPLRHGILHGRSFGYANRVVCMKTWLLMVALVDWACDKTTEDERAVKHRASEDMGLAEIAEKLRKAQADRLAIEAFVPRTNTGPFDDDMDPSLPEFAIRQFLTLWKAQNYGDMAKLAVNLVAKPARRLAGDLRETGKRADLTAFEIRRVHQTTVAAAEADVYMEGVGRTGAVRGLFRVLAERDTEGGDLAMPDEPGDWRVQQSCMMNLMPGEAIADAEPE